MIADHWAAILCVLFFLGCLAWLLYECTAAPLVDREPVAPPTEDQRALLEAWSRAAAGDDDA
jgi:hypothetical protein